MHERPLVDSPFRHLSVLYQRAQYQILSPHDQEMWSNQRMLSHLAFLCARYPFDLVRDRKAVHSGFHQLNHPLALFTSPRR